MHERMIQLIRSPQAVLFETRPSTLPVALTADVTKLLDANAAVAVGVSGGKDGAACAIAVDEYLDSIGHTGPRLLVHADLGRVEWKDSLPSCERLAAILGWELVTVRRTAGDMLARWEGRWSNNVTRYRNLSCVKLIPPWSTPALRFCTSELKTTLIASELKKRFPGQHIINVTGIRREESPKRRKMPISAPHPNLVRKGLHGITWNAIIEWPVQQVFSTIVARGLQLHEAYIRYLVSRVSCAFCIMSSGADMAASAKCPDNQKIYIDMVRLEVTSTFSFQSGKWLADVAPHLLPADLLARVPQAKEAAKAREEAEALLPSHLLYTNGWPTVVPTLEEACLIAEVRKQVARAAGIEVGYMDATSIIQRYEYLLEAKAAKAAKIGKKKK